MSDYPIWSSTLPPCPVASGIIRRLAEAGPDYVERTWAMSDELVPVVGGPKNGESWRWSTSNTMAIPDAKDRIEKVTPEGIVTLFGQHTYRLNNYAKDGVKFYRWDYVGYEPPWNIPKSDDIVDRIRFALGRDTFWDTDAPTLLEDAVKEIERLRLTGAEREAITKAAFAYGERLRERVGLEDDGPDACGDIANTLRRLLERLS